MIVKDESQVIERCLRSVLSIIDYWVIVDTGSSDDTKEKIQHSLSSVAGELHQRPWVNFEHNRTEALKLAYAKADYLLIIDADEILLFEGEKKLPQLTESIYYVPCQIKEGTTYFDRITLLRADLDCYYQGVLHEHLLCDGESSPVLSLASISIRSFSDGHRNQQSIKDKYLADAKVLETALEKEPNNARYVFYLAQSYRDAKQYQPALLNYIKRAEMGGWPEEVWYSWYQAAWLSFELDRLEHAILLFSRCYQLRPWRAESLFSLANIYRKRHAYYLSYMYAEQAAKIPLPPHDLLHIQRDVYLWQALDEMAVSCYHLGRYEQARQLNQQILAENHLPNMDKSRVYKNLQQALRGLVIDPSFCDKQNNQASIDKSKRFAVCIVSPPEYAFSATFQEVAESLHYALQALSYDSIITHDLTLKDRRYIILGSHLIPTYYGDISLAEDTILYNLEQVFENSTWFSNTLLKLFHQYVIWDYHLQNIRRLMSLELRQIYQMPIGYMPQLSRIEAVEKKWDILFYGVMNEYRKPLLEKLQASGLKVKILFKVFGKERDAYIAQSKIILNLHHRADALFELVRVSYLLANQCFIISETYDPQQLSEQEKEFDTGLVFSAYNTILETCQNYLEKPKERKQIAKMGFKIIQQHAVTQYIAPLLKS
jgi:glycosyltransferase involved in cell wall biosynthesis